MRGIEYFAIGVLILLAGYAAGYMKAVFEIKQTAGRAGYAEYVITNKQTGATEFRWKEIK